MSRDKKAKKKWTVGRVIRRVLLILMLLFLLTGGILALVVYNKYGHQMLDCRSRARVIAAGVTAKTFRGDETSICYYSDGSVMSVLKAERDVYYLDYKAIPQMCISAMLAVEDRKFYSHQGYDIYAILRAARAYIINEGEIHQGGSTITQQLARTMFLSNEQTVERKATEIFLAAELEKKFSKEQILEFYLNNIYFANGYYGLQAAAEGYFGKTIGELSLSEQAYLCGIPNSPSLYNPLKNPEKTLERRDSVLKQMADNNYISKEEYETALSEPIVLNRVVREKYDYAETFTYYCAVRALMRAEGFVFRNDFVGSLDRENYEDIYEEEYSRLKRSLFTKGYRIYTSINPEKQRMLQESINEELVTFDETNEEGIYKLQASGTCIDNETGFVVAIIGGRGQEYKGYTLNRAFQSPRQPGSSIKPLVVYTPVFERGYYPDTKVVDEKFEGGPKNSGGVYSGEIDVRYAVSVSKNTVAWKLFEELTPRTALSYLLKMNYSHLVEKDYVPAAALGGLTFGATSLEMASGYATLENDGVYRTPTCIVRISDADGKTIIDNARTATGAGLLGLSTLESKRVYEKNASRMMVDVLKTVMTSGTGRKLALKGMTSAGKTGTTNDQKDGWFVGFTTYYTTAIWVGFDYPKKQDDLMGNTYPGYIWKNYMDKIHEGLKDSDFEPYYDDRIPKEELGEEELGEGEISTNPDEENGADDPDGEDMNGGEVTGDENPSNNSGDSIGDDNLYDDSAWYNLPDGFTGHAMYIGEDGSRIFINDELYLVDYGEEMVDWEGKPVFFDEAGNRYLFDENGGRVIVNSDGYPPDYFAKGTWKLYDNQGNLVLLRVEQ